MINITSRSRKKDMRRIKRPHTGWVFQRVTTHPGEVLLEEFLKPLEISQHKLAMDIHVPATRIGEIVHGRRAITPETSLRLARYFGTSPEFWLNLQRSFDLTKARTEQEGKIAREVQAYAG
jgi:addiction module HigA family antidote